MGEKPERRRDGGERAGRPRRVSAAAAEPAETLMELIWSHLTLRPPKRALHQRRRRR